MPPKRQAASSAAPFRSVKKARTTKDTTGGSLSKKSTRAAGRSTRSTTSNAKQPTRRSERKTAGATGGSMSGGKRKRDEQPEVDDAKTAKKAKVGRGRPKKAPKPKQAKEKPALNPLPSANLEVYVFGSGDSGELGLGSEKGAIEAETPVINKNLSGPVQIALGGMHGIALTHEGRILTWGVNDNGALGRDTQWEGKIKDADAADDFDADGEDLNPFESSPIAIPSTAFPAGTAFTQVAAGDSTSFALTEDGSVYGWGVFRNANGNFGFNTTDNNEIDPKIQRQPTLVHGLKNIVQIAVGGDHALALEKNGTVYAWGAGEQSQLGRQVVGRYLYRSLIPSPVPLPKNIKSISAGANHSFAIDKNDNVYSWGLNNYGQCGISKNAGEAEAVVTKPQKVKSLSEPVKMAAGGNHHSIAVTHDGDCLTFGRLDSYAMGMKLDSLPLDDGEVVKKTESGRPAILLRPTKVPNLPAISYVAAGSDHCLAITTDGNAYSWGFNSSHQCGQVRDKGEGGDNESEDDDEDDLDEVEEATLIGTAPFSGKKLVWAGAGGQFSAIASAEA